MKVGVTEALSVLVLLYSSALMIDDLTYSYWLLAISYTLLV